MKILSLTFAITAAMLGWCASAEAAVTFTFAGKVEFGGLPAGGSVLPTLAGLAPDASTRPGWSATFVVPDRDGPGYDDVGYSLTVGGHTYTGTDGHVTAVPSTQAAEFTFAKPLGTPQDVTLDFAVLFHFAGAPILGVSHLPPVDPEAYLSLPGAYSNDVFSAPSDVSDIMFLSTTPPNALFFENGPLRGDAFPAIDSVSIDGRFSDARIPEPLTWTFFIVGFFCTGAQYRRTQTRAVPLLAHHRSKREAKPQA